MDVRAGKCQRSILIQFFLIYLGLFIIADLCGLVFMLFSVALSNIAFEIQSSETREVTRCRRTTIHSVTPASLSSDLAVCSTCSSSPWTLLAWSNAFLVVSRHASLSASNRVFSSVSSSLSRTDSMLFIDRETTSLESVSHSDSRVLPCECHFSNGDDRIPGSNTSQSSLRYAHRLTPVAILRYIDRSIVAVPFVAASHVAGLGLSVDVVVEFHCIGDFRSVHSIDYQIDQFVDVDHGRHGQSLSYLDHSLAEIVDVSTSLLRSSMPFASLRTVSIDRRWEISHSIVDSGEHSRQYLLLSQISRSWIHLSKDARRYHSIQRTAPIQSIVVWIARSFIAFQTVSRSTNPVEKFEHQPKSDLHRRWTDEHVRLLRRSRQWWRQRRNRSRRELSSRCRVIERWHAERNSDETKSIDVLQSDSLPWTGHSRTEDRLAKCGSRMEWQFKHSENANLCKLTERQDIWSLFVSGD